MQRSLIQQMLRSLMLCLLVSPMLAHAEPLSLKESVSRAVANNPNLAESRTGIAVAEKGVESAFGRHYPRISLDAYIMQRQDPIPYIPAQSTTVPAHFSDGYASLGPVLTIPIYQGGQVMNGVRLAELRQRVQEDSFILTRNELIANTVATYNKILQLKALVESSSRAVKALEEQQKNAKLLFELGRIARVDLLKVEVQKVNEEQRLLALNEALKNTCSTLQTLMGEAVGPDTLPLQLADKLAPSDLQTDFEAGLTLARNNPRFQLSNKAVDDAELNRKLAFGKFMPTLNAVAGYQQQFGFTPGYNDGVWFVGATLSLPLFDKTNYADLHREQFQKERAQQKLKAVENQIRLDLRIAQASLTESRKRISATEQAVEQSRESFRIEQEKYTAGAGIMADLLLAQAAESQSEANYTQALFDYNTAILDWHKASGDMEVYLK
ncbi:outer membrane efflux protein BepC [Geobacter sp. OR-1]|uniref:TolC family protein n=1 Tax=Geobacter sp. OR-1 TaxID=1266765 RepID=UPI000541E548|nr:TolC family protein [Geobacter sp. OR-1]GAM08342.1 outer membrane efflux protein BepC [Geobacter sp. OR-1]